MSDTKRRALSAIENLNSSVATRGRDRNLPMAALPKGKRGKALMKTANAAATAAAEASSSGKVHGGKASIRRRPANPLPHLYPSPGDGTSDLHAATEPGTPVSRAKRKAAGTGGGASGHEPGDWLQRAINNSKDNKAARQQAQHQRETPDLDSCPTGNEPLSWSAKAPTPKRQLTFERSDQQRKRGNTAAPQHRPSPAAPRNIAAGGWSSPGATRPVQLPRGIENLGNTCYMNATLQVLLGLTSFVEDLKAAAKVAAAGAGSTSGVMKALLNFVLRQQALNSGGGGNGSYHGGSPEAIKRCIEARQSDFLGSLQQDAHEFLAALLEQLHTEAVRGDSASCGGATTMPLAATSCPTSRNFSFCIEHQVTCQRCGKASCVTEQYRDLSLELPEDPAAGAVVDLQQLVADHLKDETVEKSCEECGSVDRAHSVRHRLRRLPRILTLHLKRFQAQPSVGGGPLRFSKLHSRVAVPATLELAGLLADATSPPLPLGPPLEPLPSSGAGVPEGEENGTAAAGPPDEAVAENADEAAAGCPAVAAGNDPGVAAEVEASGHGAASPPATAASQDFGGDPVEQRQLAAALEQSFTASFAAWPPANTTASAGSPTEADFAEGPGLRGGALEADFDAMVDDSPPRQPPPSKTPRKPRPKMKSMFGPARGEETGAGGGDTDAVDLVSDNDEDDPELQRALQISMMMAAQPSQPALELEADRDGFSASPSPASSSGGDGGDTAARPGAVQQPLEVYHMTEPPLPSGDAAATCRAAVYELRGVVNHLGTTSKSGHFTAHVKEPGSGRWFVHNDTSTTLLLQGDPAFDARQHDCYILFFQHCGLATLD